VLAKQFKRTLDSAEKKKKKRQKMGHAVTGFLSAMSELKITEIFGDQVV
jgi:hypothetical protein